MRLFLVRHGETDWNKEGRFQGQRDTRLSQKGLEQAFKTAFYLAEHKFNGIVSSPLSRALDTAMEICSAGAQNGNAVGAVEIIEEFTEINHGDWEGLLSTEVGERWGGLLEQWHAAPHKVRMPGGGESLEDVLTRSLAGIEKLTLKYDGDVVIASHDAVIKVMLCHFLGMPLKNFWRLKIANCSISIVELNEENEPRVSLMGDAHHLGGKFELPEQKAL